MKQLNDLTSSWIYGMSLRDCAFRCLIYNYVVHHDQHARRRSQIDPFQTQWKAGRLYPTDRPDPTVLTRRGHGFADPLQCCKYISGRSFWLRYYIACIWSSCCTQPVVSSAQHCFCEQCWFLFCIVVMDVCHLHEAVMFIGLGEGFRNRL